QIAAVRALLMSKDGLGSFKAAVSDHVTLDAGSLPIDPAVMEAVKQTREEGRKVFLATAADRRVADAIAGAIGEFDGIFASENGVNLKGEAKAKCLLDAFGTNGFDY